MIDTKNLGHETSEIMKQTCVKMLKDASLDISKVLAVSRDNPTVMRGFNRLFEEEASSQGNLQMFQAPCTLHPTHTAFKKALDQLGLNVDIFLVNMHGYFKISTARREDLIELRLELDEDDVQQFFLRHVATRWLTMKLVAERILKHWRNVTEYFVVYLPNSKETSHKEAVKSSRYQDIIKVLNSGENVRNETRLKFVVFLSGKTQVFLKTFQSLKPVAYRLFTDICLLVTSLLECVMKERFIPRQTDGKLFQEIDTRDSKLFKNSKECNFGPVVEDAIKACPENIRPSLQKEFKSAILSMIQYLITRLPFGDKFLREMTGSHPKLICESLFVPSMIKVAKLSRRFSNEEMENLNNQLNMIKRASNHPEFDESKDSFEVFWIEKLIKKVEDTVGMDFPESKKLIKIISVYPNSQGWIERGFNDTKRISESRQSVSEAVMKYSKVLLDAVREAGGPEKVHISHELVGSHQSARATYRARLAKEKKDRERAEEERKRSEVQKDKKRKHEEERQTWEFKVKKLKSEIGVVRKSISKLEEDQLKAFENAENFSSVKLKEAAVKLAKVASKNISELRSELDKKQDILSKVMSKKPKNV